MVVFAITQQNVINDAQGLAWGQPKFNGKHLTAISTAVQQATLRSSCYQKKDTMICIGFGK